MSRQNDQVSEDRASRRNAAALRAIKGGLEVSLRLQGYTFGGFSYKDRGFDHLMVLRVEREGERLVSFVGADSLAGTLVKAQRLADAGKLTFRADKF